MADSLPQHARLFNFDAQGIRVVGSATAPWFVAKDVCEALEIGKYRDALSTLDDDEKGSPVLVDTLGGPQSMSTINESGLYALIFRSRKPSARLFRRWVTSEVLPAIRQTGAYTRPAAPPSTPLIRELPAAPDLDQAAAAVLLRCLVPEDFVKPFPRSALVRPVDIAHAAIRLGHFRPMIADAGDRWQVQRLLSFFRRFQHRWLSVDAAGGDLRLWVYLTPLGFRNCRRYWISLQDNERLPTRPAALPFIGGGEEGSLV